MNITVIGGANFDISARLNGTFIAADSNPGSVSLGYGGVARNIAHNLCLLGHHVRFVSAFGNDIFGSLMHDQCKAIGMDLSLSQVIKGERSGMYLCINNHTGEMIAAVADTNIIQHLTPEYLERLTGELNKSDIIVADTNLSEDSLRFLLDQSLAPLFVDAVSSTKAWRIVNALKKSKFAHLHTLKLNHKEALAVSECQTTEEAAERLLDLGIENLYITLGNEGVYYNHGTTFPALPGEVVNTTGAGDAFLAGVIHAFSKDIAAPQTAQYGLMAARATLQSEMAVNPDIANILL